MTPSKLLSSLLLLWSVTVASDELTIAFGAEPTQVDPTRSSAGVDAYYTSLFYEQLLLVNPDLDRVNWLAESWEIVDRGSQKVIQIRIRQGVKFHNGDELTSDDFKYSYERQIDPLSRTAGRLRYIEAIEVHDDYNFDIVLSQPDGSLEPQNFVLLAIPR